MAPPGQVKRPLQATSNTFRINTQARASLHGADLPTRLLLIIHHPRRLSNSRPCTPQRTRFRKCHSADRLIPRPMSLTRHIKHPQSHEHTSLLCLWLPSGRRALRRKIRGSRSRLRLIKSGMPPRRYQHLLHLPCLQHMPTRTKRRRTLRKIMSTKLLRHPNRKQTRPRKQHRYPTTITVTA
jgi:hypothetical protein